MLIGKNLESNNFHSIVFVTNNYTPYSGGVVSSINAAIAHFIHKGYRIYVITLDFLGEKHNDPDWVYRVPCPIKFEYKSNPIAVPFRAQKHVSDLIARIKPDIVHVHHPFLLGQAGWRSARKLDIPVVFTYHTMYEHYAHYVPLPEKITQPIIKKVAIDFCNKVDGVIVPSSTLFDFVQKHGVSTQTVLIPSGIQNHFFDLFEIQKPKNKRFSLLLVSRFQKEKNISFVLDVFKKLNPIHFQLKLVGYGDEYDALQDYAYQTCGLQKTDVHFIHRPPKQHLVELYHQADLFLFPSQTDTQGLVLAEAMVGGCPVVALDGPGQRDIVCDGENGFIVEGIDHMVHTIKSIANNPSLHESLIDGARKTATRYRSEIMADKLLLFYKKIFNITK